jgi:spore coat protein U-like protein
MKHWKLLLPGFMLLLGLPAAQAAITCTSVASSAALIYYVNNTLDSVQVTLTVSCNRGNNRDPLSLAYTVAADNGNNALGQNNRAALGAARLDYDTYKTSGCNTIWGSNPQANRIRDTITWTAGQTGTRTMQTSAWVCITATQTATTAGSYLDTVNLTLRYGSSQVMGSMPVTIVAPSVCTITTVPGNIALTYTAFAATTAASTPFAVRCTSGMPYTLATDVADGVLAGVRYLLGLSATTANGTGNPQAYTITATIPGGQAGTCAGSGCSGTRAHTLTVSY